MSRKFTNAQRHYRVFEQETIAILEALLKWEDKLMGYRIHVVTDHQALEFFQTQRRLSSRQTRWMEYLSRFNFDIRYVKGVLNKAADALSRYYESDTWADTHNVSEYVNADERINNIEELPWDRYREIQSAAVEMNAIREAVVSDIITEKEVREITLERDVKAAEMAAAAETDQRRVVIEEDDDPTVFESHEKGKDLRAIVFKSENDTFIEDVKAGYDKDKLFSLIIKDPEHYKQFVVRNDLVWTKNRGGEEVLCVPSTISGSQTLRGLVVEQAHVTLGHFSSQRTSDYIRRWFWWPRITQDTEKFCESCMVCLSARGNYTAPKGLLHPLPLAKRPWESIGMDFIGPFPEVDGYNYLWVIICRMTVMVHLIPINTKTTASELSWIYMREVVRLHGLPSSIVSDRDSKFTSKWWKELHRLMGSKLLMSTAFHPQTDGVTERANRSIGQMLRAAVKPNQRDWVEKAPMIEFALNSSISASTGFAPFELNHGYMPQVIREVADEARIPPGVRSFALTAVHNMAVAHDAIIAARVVQTHHANKRRRAEEVDPFKVDQLVYLSTQNLSLPKGRASKLLPKFVGPYKIRKVFPLSSTYELELPEELKKRRIHPCFHVNLLRPHVPNDDVLFPNRHKPEPYDFGAPSSAEWYVDEITGHRWKGKTPEFEVRWNLGDTTWEPLDNCNELSALDDYLTLLNVKDWDELPRRATKVAKRTPRRK